MGAKERVEFHIGITYKFPYQWSLYSEIPAVLGNQHGTGMTRWSL